MRTIIHGDAAELKRYPKTVSRTSLARDINRVDRYLGYAFSLFIGSMRTFLGGTRRHPQDDPPMVDWPIAIYTLVHGIRIAMIARHFSRLDKIDRNCT